MECRMCAASADGGRGIALRGLGDDLRGGTSGNWRTISSRTKSLVRIQMRSGGITGAQAVDRLLDQGPLARDVQTCLACRCGCAARSACLGLRPGSGRNSCLCGIGRLLNRVGVNQLKRAVPARLGEKVRRDIEQMLKLTAGLERSSVLAS